MTSLSTIMLSSTDASVCCCCAGVRSFIAFPSFPARAAATRCRSAFLMGSPSTVATTSGSVSGAGVAAPAAGEAVGLGVGLVRFRLVWASAREAQATQAVSKHGKNPRAVRKQFMGGTHYNARALPATPEAASPLWLSSSGCWSRAACACSFQVNSPSRQPWLSPPGHVSFQRTFDRWHVFCQPSHRCINHFEDRIDPVRKFSR